MVVQNAHHVSLTSNMTTRRRLFLSVSPSTKHCLKNEMQMIKTQIFKAKYRSGLLVVAQSAEMEFNICKRVSNCTEMHLEPATFQLFNEEVSLCVRKNFFFVNLFFRLSVAKFSSEQFSSEYFAHFRVVHS